MEGLLIAEELRRLDSRLPSRRLSWRFPDADTFVLPLDRDRGALWLLNRPPDPRIELREDAPPAPGRTHSGFQDLLAARAVGNLSSAEQRKLDRVVALEFAGGGGFVETAPVRLMVELTGRNCNLILLNEAGLILGAAREIRSDINRFREIVTGIEYVPPPPYRKLDPRTAGRESLRAALAGVPLRSLGKVIDGIGPELTRTLERSAEVSRSQELDGDALDNVLEWLERLVGQPSEVVREALERPDLATLRTRERREAAVSRVEQALKQEIELLEKRLGDLDRARAAAAEADELRRRGDLLLAYPDLVPEGAAELTLPGFEGQSVRLVLDPAKGPAANAQAFYERARKREARAQQADRREPELRDRLRELQAQLASAAGLRVKELEALAERLQPEKRTRRKTGPGVRYVGPHGFQVLVGRSSRENDEITFKVARSRDLWLHVQGYRGAHVLIRAENREVPFDTVLFAARLAAAYSKAADSDNVPVDYTLRKNVWKVKGQSSGAVNFTRHKTVYVTPSRKPAEQE